MKNVVLCVILALAIVGAAGALQLDTSLDSLKTSSNCSLSFTSTGLADCWNKCDAQGCAFDRYDRSTACCFCNGTQTP